MRQPRVGLAKGVTRYIVEVKNEAGFIDLHPFRPVCGEASQYVYIDRKQTREQ